MSQVFISYHRAQRKLARLIAHRVAADGHAVWWDRGERPGDNWSEAVSRALANSSCVIVLWSRQAATSPWVLGEATAGFGRGALMSVMADRTVPPSPFDTTPTVDMQDWNGDATDLAWIRLREPLRAKMEVAERAADAQAPLPPQRMPPLRVGFSSAALAPPPPYEEKRGSGLSALMVLTLGGLGAAGWYYRDQVGDTLKTLRDTSATAPSEHVAIPAPPPPIAAASAPAAPALAADALTPVDATPPEPAVAESVAPTRVLPPVPVMTRTYEDWRDTYVPAPVLRNLPRAQAEAGVEPAVARPSTAVGEPPPSAPVGPARPEHVAITEGHAIDLDAPGRRPQPDLWLAQDRNGHGLFVGVSNAARLRSATVARATPAACGEGILRTAPISVRDLTRDGGLCVRTTEGAITAWRVERLDKVETSSVLRLRAVTP